MNGKAVVFHQKRELLGVTTTAILTGIFPRMFIFSEFVLRRWCHTRVKRGETGNRMHRDPGSKEVDGAIRHDGHHGRDPRTSRLVLAKQTERARA
ncbi:uncharacterized protein MICPUCDRAFT_66095 [Micromonas pusilla CCMP1545]|uniref:Predicted protein n=1 Tax=Micromonas pusilla (strain CCMP1545) TaxID=564608 RepID=C1NAJ2_MICPC|nr:uncharacterized protein MICPUCDRAFT_66095 [Micromonas pusilla CCMP1545]EEH50898.1 predicted protein [Micromonas pusilla CCMP1545]|eukprot:XP_003064918.1 predicted protein [Micromonas pusilla CCMP1545]